jgi:hypothetical protein
MKMKMKNVILYGLGAVLALASCSKDSEDASRTGYLQVKASVNTDVTLKSSAPDPNSFKLTISKKSDGQEVKSYAKVADAGTTPIELPTGTYIVKTSSGSFTAAAFEAPLYEATQEVEVAPNATNTAILTNTQVNAGVKVTYTDAFKAKFSDYQTAVESSMGNLTYAKDEARTGYFTPGNITIKVKGDATTFDAVTRAVAAKELVTVNIDYNATGSTTGKVTLTITVDNSVTERTEDIVINNPTDPGTNPGTNPGTDPGNNPSTGKTILSEDFASASAGAANGDNSGTLWTPNGNITAMDKVYQTAGSVKVGTSSGAGYIETKALDLSGNKGTFTVKMKVKGWFSPAQAIVTVNGVKQEVAITAAKDATSLEEKTLTFTNGTASTVIRFETGKTTYNGKEQNSRFFIDDVVIAQ